jgi:hypothetical protein
LGAKGEAGHGPLSAQIRYFINKAMVKNADNEPNEDTDLPTARHLLLSICPYIFYEKIPGFWQT